MTMTIQGPAVCDCDETEIRRRINSAGNPYFIRQCLKCGSSTGSQVSRAKIENLEAIADFDEGLLAAAAEQRKASWERQFTMRQEEADLAKRRWWREYNAYLLTSQWAEKRKRVLERDEHLCQACRKRGATTAHHLTYDHAFSEPLFDLVSVCTTCHDALHPNRDDDS